MVSGRRGQCQPCGPMLAITGRWGFGGGGPFTGGELVDGDVVEAGQPLQPGHGDMARSRARRRPARGLELVSRRLLDGVQRQPLAPANGAQHLAHSGSISSSSSGLSTISWGMIAS